MIGGTEAPNIKQLKSMILMKKAPSMAAMVG